MLVEQCQDEKLEEKTISQVPGQHHKSSYHRLFSRARLAFSKWISPFRKHYSDVGPNSKLLCRYSIIRKFIEVSLLHGLATELSQPITYLVMILECSGYSVILPLCLALVRYIWSAGPISGFPSTRETWTHWSESSQGPLRKCSISHMRKVWESWDRSAWRREGLGGSH